MTAEEAIAEIIEEMRHQIATEAHLNTVGTSDFQILFSRGKSYRNISDIISKLTGEPTAVQKIS